jgi:hypothetical protein
MSSNCDLLLKKWNDKKHGGMMFYRVIGLSKKEGRDDRYLVG